MQPASDSIIGSILSSVISSQAGAHAIHSSADPKSEAISDQPATPKQQFCAEQHSIQPKPAEKRPSSATDLQQVEVASKSPPAMAIQSASNAISSSQAGVSKSHSSADLKAEAIPELPVTQKQLSSPKDCSIQPKTAEKKPSSATDPKQAVVTTQPSVVIQPASNVVINSQPDTRTVGAIPSQSASAATPKKPISIKPRPIQPKPAEKMPSSATDRQQLVLASKTPPTMFTKPASNLVVTSKTPPSMFTKPASNVVVTSKTPPTMITKPASNVVLTSKTPPSMFTKPASNVLIPSQLPQAMFTIQVAANPKKKQKRAPVRQKLLHCIKPRPLQPKPLLVEESSTPPPTDPVSLIIHASTPEPSGLTEKERSKLIICVKEGSTKNITELIVGDLGYKFLPEIGASIMKTCAEKQPKGRTPHSVLTKTMEHLSSSNWTDVCWEILKLCPLLVNLMISIMLPPHEWYDAAAVESVLPRIAMIYAMLLQARLSDRRKVQSLISGLLKGGICEKVMATTNSHKFFMSASPTEWECVHNLYNKVLLAKALKINKPGGMKNLLDLDKWFQEELPTIIQGRKEKYITHEEITKLMKWKISRGKFRPLLAMVQTNSAELVESASKKAFKKLPNVASAIKELTVLKAVGPATASAVLAAGAPEHAPFMADESMLAIPGLTPLQYTPSHYGRYAEQVKACVKRLNKEDSSSSWTAHKVELTLWTHYMANKLDPSLLQQADRSAAKKRKSTETGATGGAKKTKTK
ncbi:uncharacterized protein [Amphiura filiformis]|uniref:uncharacterized protein n=1 Tax=Amphiura filiformis TaxID=82378 RepID=UPI003B211AD0